jgi:hypothetical protein
MKQLLEGRKFALAMLLGIAFISGMWYNLIHGRSVDIFVNALHFLFGAYIAANVGQKIGMRGKGVSPQ